MTSFRQVLIILAWVAFILALVFLVAVHLEPWGLVSAIACLFFSLQALLSA